MIVRQNRAMVITPFDSSGQRVLDTVVRTLTELDIEVFRLDRMQAGTNITNAIAGAIESADFVVVDVSRQNPSVMYELGYAHGLRKPTILLLSQDSKGQMPSDLSGNLYVVYNPSNLGMLRDRLRQIVRHYLVRE
jgi:nucleoside 2-deoxyribosyltransferase